MTHERPGEALLSTMQAEHVEWRPLLSLVEVALGEMERPVWSEAVPSRDHVNVAGQPLLSDAIIWIAPGPVRRWVHHALMIATDGASGGPRMDPPAALDTLAIFEAALAHDVERLGELARTAGCDEGMVRTLGSIVAMPMLHACRRAWAHLVSPAWAEGYCPVCGDWPALAEIRGLDSQRRLRCGRCGGDWGTEWLRCPFCGERGHEHLGSLVSEGGEPRTVEVCEQCRHYVKSLTVLAPIPPELTLLRDLDTLVLDITALERGYGRPPAPRQRVEVRAKVSRLRALFQTTG